MHYRMMDTTVPSEFCTYPYSPENNVPLLRNDMKSIFQTFKTVSPLDQLRDFTSLQEMIFSYSSCGEEEGWTVTDMTIHSHNSVEDYDSKVVTVLLASMITSTNAYLGYRRKKVIWGRALLDKDDLVLKFSSVIFSCYLLGSVNKTLVPRGWSISVHSQTKSKIIFHGSPVVRNFVIFNFLFTCVLMILPCWQLLTPKKFLYWLENHKCHSECIMQLSLDFNCILLGRACWLMGTVSFQLHKETYH